MRRRSGLLLRLAVSLTAVAVLGACAAGTTPVATSTPTPSPSSTRVIEVVDPPSSPPAARFAQLIELGEWATATVWDGVLYRTNDADLDAVSVHRLDPDELVEGVATTTTVTAHPTQFISAPSAAAGENIVDSRTVVTGTGEDTSIMFLQEINRPGSGLLDDENFIRVTAVDAKTGVQRSSSDATDVATLVSASNWNVGAWAHEPNYFGTSDGLVVIRGLPDVSAAVFDQAGMLQWGEMMDVPEAVHDDLVILVGRDGSNRRCQVYRAVDVADGVERWRINGLNLPSEYQDTRSPECIVGTRAHSSSAGWITMTFTQGGSSVAVVEPETGQVMAPAALGQAWDIQFDKLSDTALSLYSSWDFEQEWSAAVWNTGDWSQYYALPEDSEAGYALQASRPIGNRFVIHRNERPMLIDAPTGEEITPLPDYLPVDVLDDGWLYVVEAEQSGPHSEATHLLRRDSEE